MQNNNKETGPKKNKIEREGWNADEISEGASLIEEDEVRRQLARGDESKGDPNKRDAAGSLESIDTSHGREEAKNDKTGAANQNG